MRGRKSPDCDIDLGLAISATSLKSGQTRSLKDLAAFCGCTYQQIANIEQKALRKLRNLHLCNNRALAELHEHFVAPCLHTFSGRANGVLMPLLATTPDRPGRPLYKAAHPIPRYQILESIDLVLRA